MRRISGNLAGFVAACLALGAVPAAADPGSLPRGPGQRPGPKILYGSAVRAPQLTNAAPWRARPILISGASAYRKGEFLYQDFLYDDTGARATRDPGGKRASASLFSPPNGTYTYPTGPGYAGNAADLVELRVKPLKNATAFRLTLNTLVDPELTAATIAIGNPPTPRAWPAGAGVRSPAGLFVTWHGTTAEITDAANGLHVANAAVKVDRRRRQVELRVPHSAYNPHRDKVRIAAGVGLWDKAAGRYLMPGAAATATTPGGAGGLASPPALFNVAFRHREPFQALGTTALTDPAWWRDRVQAHALAKGDVSPFSAQVDFGRLLSGRNTELTGRPEGVPRTGRMNRILASRFETRQGADYSLACGIASPTGCTGQLLGRLQPYAIYVPPGRPRGGRYQLTLLLHSLTANYNQFSDSRNQVQFGKRRRPSLVITPEGRGQDGFYNSTAGADTFEVWADVARRFRLDPSRTSIAGYSMGGFGTYKLAAQFPDLFARAQPTVGAAVPAGMLASVRWVPFLMWNAEKDELVPPSLFSGASNALKDLGYRYELHVHARATLPAPAPTPQHLALALNDQFAPAARFLGRARVVRNPPRVTFVRNTAIDFPKLGTTADHAYWVSRIRARDTSKRGTIDVTSDAFGVGQPPTTHRTGRGTLRGGALGPRPFSFERTTWGRSPKRPRRDRLRISATNIASIRIDPRRARITCAVKLAVKSDGPLKVRLARCPGRD